MVAPSARKRGSKVPEAEFPAHPSSRNRNSGVMGLPALGMGNAVAIHLQSSPAGTSALTSKVLIPNPRQRSSDVGEIPYQGRPCDPLGPCRGSAF